MLSLVSKEGKTGLKRAGVRNILRIAIQCGRDSSLIHMFSHQGLCSPQCRNHQTKYSILHHGTWYQ